MKNNTLFLGAVVSVLLGLFIGYVVWGNNDAMDNDMMMSSKTGGHMMPDGTMMGGNMDMKGAMDSMTAGLEGKIGDSFDKSFIEEMVVHHEGAVAMASLALKNAKHQEVRILAGAIISAQNKEIFQMKEWYQSWYGR